MLTPQTEQEIIQHAHTVYPLECCGLVCSSYMDGMQFYYPCKNIHSDPENYFEIDPADLIQAELLGEVVALVHSHPEGEPVLSIADRQMQDLAQLDFILAMFTAGSFELHFFPKIAPLAGREFQHGISDCYTIFKDFYYLSGLDMENYAREDDWWAKGGNLYLDNMAQAGFKRLENGEIPQIGDVILMQVGADVPNHAGIYLGNQQVLHHSPKRLSKRDLYDGYWLKHTHSIWRYKQWQNLDFTAALNNLARHSN